MPAESLRIPQPAETTMENCMIAATLEVTDYPHKEGEPRPIALLLHGTMGHKDYLFQKRLAQKLPMDSCRFDFRGNHESPGSWSVAGGWDDVQDIQAVVAYLTQQLGYRVTLVVAHSRGNAAGMMWASMTPEGQGLEGYVAVSARKRMPIKLSGDAAVHWRGKKSWDEYQEKGYYTWDAKVAGKPVSKKIYMQDLADFALWDTNHVPKEFPARAHVLGIHGLMDSAIPPFDAILYARDLQNRPHATHTLHFIESADHWFYKNRDEVVDTVVAWWQRKEQGLLRDGIWNPSLAPPASASGESARL